MNTRFILMNCGLSSHQADWNWPNVRSPFLRIYYVAEGRATVEIGGKRHPLTPGHLYLIPAYVTHNDNCNGLFTHYYAHVYEDSQFLHGYVDRLAVPFEVVASGLERRLFERLVRINPGKQLVQTDPKEYDNNRNLLRSLTVSKEESTATAIENEGIICILLSRFLSNASAKGDIHDDRIEKALSHIRLNIMENIDIGTVADSLGLSKDYFIRLFQKEVGTTPAHYIVTKKVERAELMLVTEDVPIKNIAYALSFQDNSYFNRVFKKYTGMTPLDYKRQFFSIGEPGRQEGHWQVPGGEGRRRLHPPHQLRGHDPRCDGRDERRGGPSGHEESVGDDRGGCLGLPESHELDARRPRLLQGRRLLGPLPQPGRDAHDHDAGQHRQGAWPGDAARGRVDS